MQQQSNGAFKMPDTTPIIGFIGLGNVGGKLAGSLVRHGLDTRVFDLDSNAVDTLVKAGASNSDSAATLAKDCDIVITCLPSPAISAKVMEGEDGILEGMTPDTIWCEMSTTDAAEVKRLATANLLSLCEAWATASACGMDLATTYEAIRVSSGNSFVHETESQVILNGSRDINFTMELVLKDIGLFQSLAERADVPLEINPLMISIMQDGANKYGGQEWSPNIIRRLEEATGQSIIAKGFPASMTDDEPEAPGYEVYPRSVPT